MGRGPERRGATTRPTSPAPPGVSSGSPRALGAPIVSWWRHPSRRRGALGRGGAVVASEEGEGGSEGGGGAGKKKKSHKRCPSVMPYSVSMVGKPSI